MNSGNGAISVAFLLVMVTILGAVTFTARNVSAAWNIETVDSAGAVGQNTAITLDSSGYPHISYMNFSNYDLKYAKWTGSAWSIATVDSGGSVGRYSSIAVNSSGYPHISYLDSTNGNLKYAKWTGSAWSISTVDSSGNAGADTSIVLDASGHPHISYYQYAPDFNLKYAEWTGSAWSIATVDSAGTVGEDTSIALDSNGYPWISYLDYTNYDLKLARWTGSSWSLQTVDSAGYVGEHTSLKIDSSDYPHIGYYEYTPNFDLKYAAWNGSAWNIETIDSAGTTGEHASLELETSGRPCISYYDSTNGNLKYAAWTGSSWSVEAVDATGDVGGDTSLALDSSGFAHISYLDYTNFDLKYARWTGGPPNNPPDTPSVPSGPTSGVVATSYTYSTAAADPDGDQVRYTFDWGDTATSQTGWVASGTTASQTHAWSAEGVYQVRARAEDSHGALSGWSGPLAVTIIAPPSAPIALAATPGDTEVTLTWSAPADDGGSPVFNYSVYRGTTSGGEVLLVTIGNVLAYLDMGLTNGITYFYQVSAINAAGEGPRSNEASATPASPITPPSAPQSLVAMAGNGNVTLTWAPPLSDGGSPITNYVIHRGATSGGETFLVMIGPVLTHLDIGLTNGVTYYYLVAAVNVAGRGPNSTEASATPMTTPTEPLNLQAFPGNGQIVLTWSAPASDGGSPITNYEIYRGTVSNGETFLVEVGNAFTHLDAGLTNGQTYYYKVSARNIAGEGPLSGEASATPMSSIQPPSAPQNLAAVGGDGSVSLTWQPPADDGGSPIINYVLYRGIAPGGESFLVKLGSVLAHPDTGLTNGITYYYTVAAVNSAGEGPNSTEAGATPMTTPSEPLNLQAAPGDGLIILTWDVPSSDGGSQITNYEIYRGLASGSETFLVEVGNVLTHQDSGLTNGIPYYYEVSAKNGVGEGPQSNEASATPSASIVPPSAPRNLAAAGGDGSVTLTWAPPISDGGSSITNYRIFRGTASGGETYLTEIGNIRNHLDAGLTNGVTYYYIVAAVNAAGQGPDSNEASATPMTTPSPPLNLQASPGDGQVVLTWSMPTSDGGSAIINYDIYRGVSPNGETFLTEIGVTLTYADASVTNGQTYFYKVSAKNGVGEGSQSNEASATPTSPPANQPPECAINAPSPGATISGEYLVTGTASDPDGAVVYVEVNLDGGSWMRAVGTSSWGYTLDTTELGDGQHTIYARSFDGVNYSAVAEVDVTIDNAKSPPSEGKPIIGEAWFWALVVIVVAIMILLMLLLLGRRKKKQQPAEQEGSAPERKG